MGNTESSLEFLSTYWETAKKLSDEIVAELPKISEPKIDPECKFFTVKFSDLGRSWAPEDIKTSLLGKSPTLEKIALKLKYMILKGDAANVKPHLIKVVSEGKWRDYRMLAKKYKSLAAVHELTETEVNRIKEYFQI